MNRLALILTLAGACIVRVDPVTAEDVAGDDPHRAHREAMAQRYTTILETYQVPDLTLVDQDGHQVDLESALAPSRPVALNFVFTTCTTICPVMSATFSRLRSALGSDGKGLRLVTISVDPEFDTPGVLKKYAERYGASPEWTLLTGDTGRISSVLRAFKAYYGGKTNHRPLTFLHIPGEARWVRIEGLATASDLAREYRRLTGRDA